jgi:hypothetical protein
MSVEQDVAESSTAGQEISNDSRKSHHESKFRKWEIAILAAGLIATAGFGFVQVNGLQTNLESSTGAAIYAQQQDIDKIFVDMTYMQEFFWKDKPLPGAGGPPVPGKSAALVEAEAAAVASRILDHFEHLTFQMDKNAFSSEQEAWEAYIRESFKTSPTLCHTLWEDRDEYGGTASDSMWKKYAEGNCPEVQTS